MLLHVTAPEELVYERARSRGQVTGRKVPRASIARALEGCPKAFSVLAPLVDVAVEVRAEEFPVLRVVGESGILGCSLRVFDHLEQFVGQRHLRDLPRSYSDGRAAVSVGWSSSKRHGTWHPLLSRTRLLI